MGYDLAVTSMNRVDTSPAVALAGIPHHRLMRRNQQGSFFFSIQKE